MKKLFYKIFILFKRNLLDYQEYTNLFKHYWLIIISAMIVFSAFMVLLTTKDLTNAAQIGDWLAGFASSLAFLWLIAGYKQQQKELQFQREELTLQRQAIELQAKELKNIGKFAALEQVQNIVNNMLKEIHSSDTPYNHPNEFAIIFSNPEFIKMLEIFLDSEDSNEIIQAYEKWRPIEFELRYFISKIYEASIIYLEQTDDIDLTVALPQVEFILKYQESISNIPYISECRFAVQTFIPIFIKMEKYLKAIQMAFTAASTSSFNKILKEDFNKDILLDLKNELDKEGIEYPAIIKKYINDE